MKPYFLIALFFVGLSFDSKSQDSTNAEAKKFLRKYYNENQIELDKNTSGIGIEFSTQKYGSNYQPVDFKKNKPTGQTF